MLPDQKEDKHGYRKASHCRNSGIQRLPGTVEKGEGNVYFSMESSVINQYGNQIRKVALETLKNLGVSDVKLTIVDKGALDCTIKARIEAAVYRSVLQTEHLPWGGAIR